MKGLKPAFWDYYDVAAGGEHLFNFRRMWKLTVLLTTGVALIPLIILAIIDYQVTQHSIESENLLRTARLVSNTHLSLSFFFTQRKAALDFVCKEYDFETLCRYESLNSIIKNLQASFGGITDIGLIDSAGNQRNYVGPYNLLGKNYADQEWYQEVCKRGVYISDVFLGFRQVPHIVLAVKHPTADGSFYILRTTLDTSMLNDLLSSLELAGNGDIFLVNRQGIIQTPTLYHGNVLEQLFIPVPNYSDQTKVIKGHALNGSPVIIGYKYIPNTPFIIILIQETRGLMQSWNMTRLKLLSFLVVSIILIIGVIIGVSTYLINKIFIADQARIASLHQVEYSNKMASIGRLAAGVAHEVNNPLAIINEKAGLLKDLITIRKKQLDEKEILALLDSILASVKRAGTITKRLLSFSRQMEVNIQQIDLKETIEEVLDLMKKEAEYRSINIAVEERGDIPKIECDKGKLQEIFLNLLNNAFAAVDDGGHINIKLRKAGKGKVVILFGDDGCGIPKEDIGRIFEPFFSTKTKTGGTGLGLSLTANFIRELGGEISVESEVGKGTTFTITLPVKMVKEDKRTDESPADRR